MKIPQVVGITLLCSALVWLGYPRIYAHYIKWATKRAATSLSDKEASDQLGQCTTAVMPPFASKASLQPCMRFYAEYLPMRTKALKPGESLPFDAAKVHIVFTYQEVNRRLNSLGEPPLDPLARLSNGWAVAP